MKRFLVFAAVMAGLMLPFGAYALDEQEKAYQTQYENLTKQIADANQRKELIKSERVQQLPSVMAGDKTRDNELIAEFKALDGKVKAWTAEKQDLKSKVAEKYGKLPKWWADTDIK